MNELVLVLSIYGLVVSIFALLETIKMDSVEEIYQSDFYGWTFIVMLFLALIYLKMGN